MIAVTIKVGILRSQIIGNYPVRLLSKELSYKEPGYQFTPSYQKGLWNGTVTFLTRTSRFPTSFLEKVIAFMKARNIKVTLSHDYDLTSFTNLKIDPPRGFTLYDYQTQSVNDILKRKRGTAHIATGGGKTLIAVTAIKSINLQTIFLVHKRDLLHQTHKILLKALPKKDVGIIGDGYKTYGKFTVASIPTLWRNYPDHAAFLKKQKVLFADEVHHAKSSTWSKLMGRIPAIIRIGLTATPGRKGSPSMMRLESVTGPVITRITTNMLTKRGYLSKAHVIMITTRQGNISDRYSHQYAYKHGIEQNEYRNNLIAEAVTELIKGEHTPILIIVRTVNHLNILSKCLTLNEIDHTALYGASSREERRKCISRAESGKQKVILSTSIFEEGVDIPSLKGLVIAAGGKSDKLTIQRVGRSLRKTEDGESVVVIDFFDRTQKYLKDHSKHRLKVYKLEKHYVTNINESDVHKLLIHTKKVI